jgi:hypothetical protein
MTMKSIRTAALVLTFAAGACAKDAAQQDMPRQVELAPQASAQPQLNDAPKPEVKPEPAKPAPRPKPAPKPAAPVQQAPAPIVAPAPVAAAPAAPATGIISAGTTFAVAPSSKICTNTHKAGDRFTTSLATAVYGSNGVTIPAGSTVTVRVLESARSEDSKDKAKLTLDVMSVIVGGETYEVGGTVTPVAPFEMVRAQSTEEQVKKVGVGAAIGAIAGQILGKNTKSTVIGTAVGAAAGGVVASAMNDYDACIGTGASLNVALDRDLRIRRQ